MYIPEMGFLRMKKIIEKIVIGIGALLRVGGEIASCEGMVEPRAQKDAI